MARTAREKTNFGTYHIWQTSKEGQLLFEDPSDRTQFISILNRLRGQFAFKIIAYCLTSDSGYHLVLELEGTDLSKLMKSLNIGYAMHKKLESPLFRDRYKSKMLQSKADVEAVFSKLCCDYSHIDILENPKEDDEAPTICENCMTSFESAKTWLEKSWEAKGLDLSTVLKDKNLRNEYMLRVRKGSTLSLKEIGQLFGDLSESTVCKILKSACGP